SPDAKPLVTREEGLRFQNILRKLTLVACKVAAQRLRHALVRTRRAPEAEVDASGKQGLERSELFGDDHRRVIGEHDSACANANLPRRLSDVGEHDRGCRTRDPRYAVMFCNPISLI